MGQFAEITELKKKNNEDSEVVDEYFGGILLKRNMNRRPKAAMHLLTVREVRNKKHHLEKLLHKSISKKKTRIHDLNPKPTAKTHRKRGNGMSEEQVMKEIMPYISGHGLKGDNHKVSQIITRSLHAYPRLKHLYTNGLAHGNEQPPKRLYTTAPKSTVAAPSKFLSV